MRKIMVSILGYVEPEKLGFYKPPLVLFDTMINIEHELAVKPGGIQKVRPNTRQIDFSTQHQKGNIVLYSSLGKEKGAYFIGDEKDMLADCLPRIIETLDEKGESNDISDSLRKVVNYYQNILL